VRRLALLVLAGGVVACLLAFLRNLFKGPPQPIEVTEGSKRAEPPTSALKDAERNGTAELNREQLYAKAKRLGIEGRSKMSKRQLQQAVTRRESGDS
jgi:hypothetical protein